MAGIPVAIPPAACAALGTAAVVVELFTPWRGWLESLTVVQTAGDLDGALVELFCLHPELSVPDGQVAEVYKLAEFTLPPGESQLLTTGAGVGPVAFVNVEGTAAQRTHRLYARVTPSGGVGDHQYALAGIASSPYI